MCLQRLWAWGAGAADQEWGVLGMGQGVYLAFSGWFQVGSRKKKKRKLSVIDQVLWLGADELLFGCLDYCER